MDIIDEAEYYPFGLKHENYAYSADVNSMTYKYKFGGKELQNELGMNVYDFGARNYDPSLGRWMNMDPLAETSRRFSPYAYALNNPVYFIDPDGMAAVEFMDFESAKPSDPGDYFGRDGEYLGTDDIDDGKAYVLKENFVPNKENKTVNFGGKLSDTHINDLKNKSNEIDMDSDLGNMIRTVYSEMRGGDDDAKAIVAESIKNRSDLNGKAYEKADGTYEGIVNKFYDVSKANNDSNDVFKNPKDYIYKNEKETSSWRSSVGASIKADAGMSDIGNGVIFYNSASSTIYDTNPKIEKINLDIKVKGLWKLK